MYDIVEFLCSHKGAVAVRQPYIRVVGIEQTSEANSRGPTNFSVDEVVIMNIIYYADVSLLISFYTVA